MKKLGYVFNGVAAFTVVCLVLSIATHLLGNRPQASSAAPQVIPTPAMGR